MNIPNDLGEGIHMPKALAIAASDSGGACGIQADIKTFSALGVYACTVITSVTAQNSTGMQDVQELSCRMVEAQARMVVDDIRPEAVKVGMIGSADNYRILGNLLAAHRPPHLVVDPVITCYRGCPWVLGDDAIELLGAHLLPLTDVFAPSIPDAEVMLGRSIRNPADMEEAAKAIKELGPRYVVLKGGHLEGDPVDVVWDGERTVRLSGKRIDTPHDNGSGCAFSSAIAALLAHGLHPLDAVREAKRYMEGALLHGYAVGAGHGPVHHFHDVWPQETELWSEGVDRK